MKQILFLFVVLTLFSCLPNNTKIYNILDYGAKPDGKSLSTHNIQAAIDDAADNGGGTVVFPSGKFLSGTIFLKDNITLNIESGATLLGSENLIDYQMVDKKSVHPNQKYHLIIGNKVKNISIIGNGYINGQGKALCNLEDTMPKWVYVKDINKRVEPMIEIYECEDVIIRDVHISNFSGWNTHIFNSKKVNISGIKIINDQFSPNSDAIDITGCHDVMINNCYIKTCDDGICIKTSEESNTSERITVTNCIIETNCAALKVGNESVKDMHDITFSNCVINNTSRPIGIYSQEGANLSNISISNIVANTRTVLVLNRPIHISLYQKDGFKLGSIKNVQISNFTCTTNGRILITAQDSSMIENILLRDIRLIYPHIENPLAIADSAKSSQFSPKNKNARKQPYAIVVENVKNLVLDNLMTDWNNDSVPTDWQIPTKIENGSKYRTFHPNYYQTHETEFGVLWGNNLQGGYIRIPMATSSVAGIEKVKLSNSTIIQ